MNCLKMDPREDGLDLFGVIVRSYNQLLAFWTSEGRASFIATTIFSTRLEVLILSASVVEFKLASISDLANHKPPLAIHNPEASPSLDSVPSRHHLWIRLTRRYHATSDREPGKATGKRLQITVVEASDSSSRTGGGEGPVDQHCSRRRLSYATRLHQSQT